MEASAPAGRGSGFQSEWNRAPAAERNGPARPLPQSDWPAFLRVGEKQVLAALGISPPKSLPHRKEVLLGVGRVPGCDNATVAVYVSAFPARFWRIEINRKDHARLELNAGTVDLQKLWTTIELIARSMLDIRVTWPFLDMACKEDVDEAPAPAAELPLVSLGQGEYARDLAGKPAAFDPHSPTQGEVSAARCDSLADQERKRLRKALQKIAYEPFGAANASTQYVLDAITKHARDVLAGGAA